MDDSTRSEYGRALDAAHRHAVEWLESVEERPIRPDLDVYGILSRLVPILPEAGMAADAVIDELAEAAGPASWRWVRHASTDS